MEQQAPERIDGDLVTLLPSFEFKFTSNCGSNVEHLLTAQKLLSAVNMKAGEDCYAPRTLHNQWLTAICINGILCNI